MNPKKVLLATVLLTGLALPSHASSLQTHAFAPEEWTLGCGSGSLANHYTVSEESIVSRNFAMRGNFAVKDDVNAIGDYTVSVSGSGVSSWPVT